MISLLRTIRHSKSVVGIAAAGCTFGIVHLLDAFLATHGLHAEVTYFDDVLLSTFVFLLVYTLESFHRRQEQRSLELEQMNVDLRQQAETVRELSGQLLRLQDEERKRFARELHDQVGQLLAAVSMKLATVAGERNLSPLSAQAVKEGAELVSQLSREVRTISHLMHPPLLDEVGLESALRWYIEGFAERSGIGVDLDFPSPLKRLPHEMELSVFRMVQEALTNIHRHSGSPSARVCIARNRDQLKVEIRDAGHGIPPEKQLLMSRAGRAGVGIRGMQERIRQLGGTLLVQSDGSGTILSADLPLPNEDTVRMAS